MVWCRKDDGAWRVSAHLSDRRVVQQSLSGTKRPRQHLQRQLYRGQHEYLPGSDETAPGNPATRHDQTHADHSRDQTVAKSVCSGSHACDALGSERYVRIPRKLSTEPATSFAL